MLVCLKALIISRNSNPIWKIIFALDSPFTEEAAEGGSCSQFIINKKYKIVFYSFILRKIRAPGGTKKLHKLNIYTINGSPYTEVVLNYVPTCLFYKKTDHE